MTDRFRTLGLTTKAAVFVGAVFVCWATVVTTFNVLFEGAVARAAVARSLAQGISAITVGTEDAVRVRNADALAPLAENLARQTGVVEVVVLDADLRRLADGDPATPTAFEAMEHPLAARALETGRLAESWGEGGVDIAAPIVSPVYGPVGVVAARASFAQLAPQTRSIAFANLILGLGGLFVALWATWRFVAHAMRPIGALEAAAAAVAARNYDITLDIKTGDEFETLGAAFTDMVGRTKDAVERMRRLAFGDPLTGLPNKTAFTEQLARTMAQSNAPGAVLLINLDRFKRLNDTFGQSEGDRILVGAAERLRAAVRDIGARYDAETARKPFLARITGDEFVVLFCGPAPTGVAKEAAKRIGEVLAKPLTVLDQSVTLSASIGIARWPIDAADPDNLMRNANLALDAAKADGTAAARFFEPEMTRRAVERVTLEAELREAIANREFEVHYQPKVDARTSAIVGCEALVRWRRRGRIVGPGAFVSIAEESGLIVEIGQQVLEQSCRAAAAWTTAGHAIHVAVNVSAVQFDREDFSRQVLRVLKTTGLDPAYLELELTESVAMNEAQRIADQIEPLRAKGVRFAIDDFGTGYSSLSSLTRLPFDVFKIDQSFVRGMTEDRNARVVVETILAMAKALGYETVAEGVEDPAHFAVLRLAGCGYAQGWLFGKPVPEAEFVALLDAARAPLRAAG